MSGLTAKETSAEYKYQVYVTALYDFHVLFQVVRVHTMNRGYPYKSREKVRKIVLAEINSRYTGVKRY